MDLIKSGSYIGIFLCQNMCNNKNKHSGAVSCSACNAFIHLGSVQLVSCYSQQNFLYTRIVDQISTFFVRCLGSMICILVIYKVSRF